MTVISILNTIAGNDRVTISEIAKASGTTEHTVQRYLKEFQDNNALRREGSDISGRWVLQ